MYIYVHVYLHYAPFLPSSHLHTLYQEFRSHSYIDDAALEEYNQLAKVGVSITLRIFCGRISHKKSNVFLFWLYSFLHFLASSIFIFLFDSLTFLDYLVSLVSFDSLIFPTLLPLFFHLLPSSPLPPVSIYPFTSLEPTLFPCLSCFLYIFCFSWLASFCLLCFPTFPASIFSLSSVITALFISFTSPTFLFLFDFLLPLNLLSPV